MNTNHLFIFNCFLFLCFLMSSIEGSMLSIIAYAAIANLLRPKPRYQPPPIPQVPQVPYESQSQSVASPLMDSQLSPSFLTQTSLTSSKRGFGYPGGGISIDNNPVTDWAKSLQSHPESQKVPSFYGSYPANGYQIFNGPPPPSRSMFPKKPGIQPVFKLAGIGDHFKSVPEKGLFQF